MGNGEMNTEHPVLSLLSHHSTLSPFLVTKLAAMMIAVERAKQMLPARVTDGRTRFTKQNEPNEGRLGE